MLITLPNGLLDGPDLFNLAEIDELKGKQQNYLVDKALVVNNIGHVPKIVEDMLLSLQTQTGVTWQGKMSEAIQKLPSGDLETILVKVRENTYGPKFFHEATCTHCGHINKNLRVDLDTLELDAMTIEEMLKPKVVMLPKLQIEAELKAIYLKDLFEVVKISLSKGDSLITSMLTTSIKRLGDKSPVTAKDIENIPVRDLNYLEEQLKDLKLEGSIDTALQIECQECKLEFEAKLNCFDPNFFSHSKGYTS
jgi:hypothetical protein